MDCHKIILKRGRSSIDSLDSMKNNGDKCFQYAATLVLDHEDIAENSERTTKIKPFIDKYDCEKINYPSEKDDFKKSNDCC